MALRITCFKTVKYKFVKKGRLSISGKLDIAGLAVVLDRLQLHVHSAISCLVHSAISFVRYQQNHRQKVFSWGTSLVFRGVDISKIWQKIHWITVLHIWRIGDLFGGLSRRGDRAGEQQTSISKTVLPHHAKWDIGLILMLSGDYNFLPSTASELNNFIQ